MPALAGQPGARLRRTRAGREYSRARAGQPWNRFIREEIQEACPARAGVNPAMCIQDGRSRRLPRPRGSQPVYDMLIVPPSERAPRAPGIHLAREKRRTMRNVSLMVARTCRAYPQPGRHLAQERVALSLPSESSQIAHRGYR